MLFNHKTVGLIIYLDFMFLCLFMVFSQAQHCKLKTFMGSGALFSFIYTIKIHTTVLLELMLFHHSFFFD